MDYVFILSILITVLSAITIIISWQLWKITNAKSILCILVAMILGFINRIMLVCECPDIYTRIISMAFWLLWVIGLWNLLKIMRKYTNQTNGGFWNTFKKWAGLK